MCIDELAAVTCACWSASTVYTRATDRATEIIDYNETLTWCPYTNWPKANETG
jgi:hypothetical protein